MLSIEEIKMSMGQKATQASYMDELVELLVDDIPYFYAKGILTESFLTSAFSLRQLTDHQFFIQQPSEKLNVTKLEGNYVIMGGQVNQYTEDAHGIFLPGTTASVKGGACDFLGSAVGELWGESFAHAYHNSQVTARDCSCVMLHNEACGTLLDDALGYAEDACSVQVSNQGRLTVWGRAFFLARHRASVDAEGSAFGVVADEVELTCTANNRVIPLSDTVAIKCPSQNRLLPMPDNQMFWEEVLFQAARQLSVSEREAEFKRLYPNWD